MRVAEVGTAVRGGAWITELGSLAPLPPGYGGRISVAFGTVWHHTPSVWVLDR